MLIEGELSAESNGVMTTLTGSGSSLVWDLGDPIRAARNLPVGRSDLRRAADLLKRAEVTLEVRAAGQCLVDIGATRSLLGLFVLGTTAVRPRALVTLYRMRRAAAMLRR